MCVPVFVRVYMLEYIFMCRCFDCRKENPCHDDTPPCRGDGQECVFNTSLPNNYYCKCKPGFEEVTAAPHLTCTGRFYEHSVCIAVFVIIRYVFNRFSFPFKVKMTDIRSHSTGDKYFTRAASEA